MDQGSEHGAPSRVEKERDFYRKLLDLGGQDALEPFLAEALALIVEVSGARRGYIETRHHLDSEDRPGWWIARGFSDDEVQAIRGSLSRGVIAEAVATGRTIVTASALDDPRFKKRGSVKANRIEAVLCAPIGATPPIGVVYLQDRAEPGPFSEDDRLRAELFARHLAPLTDRLVIRQEQRDEGDPTKPYREVLKVSGLIGRSSALARILYHVKVVAPSRTTVLLTGATGTGKTEIARVIHENSPRSRGPFVALNCANLSEQLAESLLFGHEKGAFTDAYRPTQGKVTAANGGTLFMDELGELPLGTQAKLLKFLDTGEYQLIGSNKTLHADVRIVAATNVDPEAAIADGKLRRDLYHRVADYPIHVASLAERREDIADLAALFCARACEVNGFPVLRFSPGAVRAAEAAEWPGNIRQLAAAANAAVLRANGSGVLDVEREHLFPDEGSSAGNGAKGRLTLQAAMRRFQAEYVREVLEEVEWNIAEAGRALDVVRSHVYNLIKVHGLARKK